MTDYNEPISDAGHVVGDGLVQRIKDLEAKIEQLTELANKYKWQVRDTCTRAEKAEQERDALREALIKARQFIDNGIELGFINLPEDKGDPSHDTLPAIRAALEAKP